MKFISILLIILVCFSCTERMDIDLQSTDPLLTVEGSVTTDLKKHQVILSETSDVYNAQKAIPVSNAEVKVSDGDQFFTYTEIQPGHYESDVEFAGQATKTYSLQINNVDINKDGDPEEYSASCYLHEAHVVDEIQLRFDPDYDAGDDEEGKFWLVTLYLEDDEKSDDYYAFACRINNVLVHDTITEITVQKDTYFNGEETNGVDVGELNQSKQDETLHANDLVTLETYSISKEHYNFINQLKEMSEDQSMFSGPPGNIETNISNGGIGFFSAYSITRTSTTLQEN